MSANPSSFFPPHPLEKELQRSLPEMIQKYKGSRLNISTLPPFQQDGMKYYTDFSTYNGNTDIGVTVKIDITTAEKNYKNHFSKVPGATFSLFLMWTLMKAMQLTPAFNYRFICGQWYEFSNLSLFTTSGASGELNNLKMDDVVDCNWMEFCTLYKGQLDLIKSMSSTQTFSYADYAIATHITSVPLAFKSVSIPTPKKGIEIERPMFVMGERSKKNDKIFMPLYAKLPHASLHPGHFRKLLSDWEGIRNTEPKLEEGLRLLSKL